MWCNFYSDSDFQRDVVILLSLLVSGIFPEWWNILDSSNDFILPNGDEIASQELAQLYLRSFS